jgi:hypothetical protein
MPCGPSPGKRLPGAPIEAFHGMTHPHLLGQEEAPGEHCGDIHSPCVSKYWEQPAGARQLR